MAVGVALGCAPSGGDGTTRIFAAASLADVMIELGDAFRASNAEVDLEFSFAGSASLRLQIEEGAPADVFVSADALTIEELRESLPGLEPLAFATNSLVIGVAADNPTAIESVRKPLQSRLGRSRPERSGRIERKPIAVTTAIGTIIQNAHCQP